MKKTIITIVATLLVGAILGYIIGVSVGEKSAILNAKIVDVTDHEVYIDYGHQRLDNGHYSKSNTHVYEYAEWGS